MNQSKREQIPADAKAIAELLYEDTPEELLCNLEDIEVTVRQHVLEYISPEIAALFIEKQTGTSPKDKK